MPAKPDGSEGNGSPSVPPSSISTKWALPEKLEKIAKEIFELWRRGKTMAMDGITRGLSKRQVSLVYRRAQRLATAGG